MARVTIVKRAQQRYDTKPVIDPATGQQKIVRVMKRTGEPKLTKKGREIIKRVTEADKTKPLPNHKCERCGTVIEVGESYKWIKPKSGPYGGRMRVRCIACPSWRPSETTSSAALSAIYAAQEAAEAAINSWDGEDLEEIKGILEECAEGVREGAECWRESGQNIEDGFGHATSTSEELIEKADNAEGSADEMANAGDYWEDFDEDAVRAEKEADVLDEYVQELADQEGVEIDGPTGTLEDAMANIPTFDAEEYERRIETVIEEAKEEWADGIRSEASDAIGNVDF